MSRLCPEQKALIRAASGAYDKDQVVVGLMGVLCPLLWIGLGQGKLVAEKFDLGPRSTRVFLRVLASRRSQRKVARAA